MIGSAHYLALSRIRAQVGVLNGIVLNHLGSSTVLLWCYSVKNLPKNKRELSGVMRANRFARFARITRFARIGNSSDSGESARRAINIGVQLRMIRANRVANRPCH